jgi:hypothetical protein
VAKHPNIADFFFWTSWRGESLSLEKTTVEAFSCFRNEGNLQLSFAYYIISLEYNNAEGLSPCSATTALPKLKVLPKLCIARRRPQSNDVALKRRCRESILVAQQFSGEVGGPRYSSGQYVYCISPLQIPPPLRTQDLTSNLRSRATTPQDEYRLRPIRARSADGRPNQ